MKVKVKYLCFAVLCCITLGFTLSASAQQKDLKTLRDDKQSDGYVGVALVIGNANYKYATKLNSPVNDAGDVAGTLSSLGFKVLRVRADATFEEMDSAVADFGRELSANKGVGIFYYSGHGVQSSDKNYLIPVDASIPLESFLKSRSLDTDVILQTMAYATKGFKVVILDACRNNPFAKSWGYKGSVDNGLAGIYSAPKGMLIAYATSPNDTASDGNGRNSPYTEVLLKEMVEPGVRIAEMFDNVRENLDRQTNGDQTPWESTSLVGRFCFAGCNTLNTQQPNDSLSRIKEAEEFFKKGDGCANTDYDCQILNYSKAIELNPNFAEAYNNRGNAYYFKKDYDAAIRDFTKAIELNPKNDGAYILRGFSYLNKQDYDSAIRDYSKAIEISSKDASAYIGRGFAYYFKKDYDTAIRDYSKAIELNPMDGGNYNIRGNAYSDKQYYDMAIRDYSKAIELNPKDDGNYYNCGSAYLNKQDYDAAIRNYSKAIELNSQFALAYKKRAISYDKIGESAKAEADRKKYKELGGK